MKKKKKPGNPTGKNRMIQEHQEPWQYHKCLTCGGSLSPPYQCRNIGCVDAFVNSKIKDFFENKFK